VIFSLDLFLLVLLSEILRYIALGVSTGITSGIPILIAYSVVIFFLFVFGILPLTLFGLWLVNPLVIKKLLVQFGLSEGSLNREKDDDDEDDDDDD